MAERWELMNKAVKPLDDFFGLGLAAMRRAGLYDPFRDWLYGAVRGFQRNNFEQNHDLEIVGLENIPETGAALLAANHQSWLDVQVLTASVDRRITFIAKAMFTDWPFLHHLIDMTDSIYIRRGGDSWGLRECAEALEEGKLVCIFPEGTIPGEEHLARWEVEPDTGLLPGKSGVIRLAHLTGAPIIPVGISGTGRAFPPEVYPRLQELPKQTDVRVTVRFGEPIYLERKTLEEMDRAELAARTKEVMHKISALIDWTRHLEPVTLPIERRTEPTRLPPYALRSEPPKKKGRKKKAPVGVLALHGFTSHISCVSPIAGVLDERGVPYRFPILRGHGTQPADLAGVTARDWYEDAENALLDLLSECEQVAVFGHSMGGLVALELAARHGDVVAGCVVASPALSFADPLSVLSPVLAKVVKFWPSPKAFHDEELAKANQNYPKFATDAFASLYRYAGEVTNLLSFVKVPVVVLHSRKDQVISADSAELVLEKVSSRDKRVVWFEESGHEMYMDLEAQRVLDETARALDGFLAAKA